MSYMQTLWWPTREQSLHTPAYVGYVDTQRVDKKEEPTPISVCVICRLSEFRYERNPISRQRIQTLQRPKSADTHHRMSVMQTLWEPTREQSTHPSACVSVADSMTATRELCPHLGGVCLGWRLSDGQHDRWAHSLAATPAKQTNFDGK